MIKSMTGYSKAELIEENYSISIEIKSLNGKNLEINTRLPKNFNEFELEIRNLIKQKVFRGSLSVNINIIDELTENKIKFDLKKAENIFNELNEIKRFFKFKEALKLEHLYAFSNQYLENSSNAEHTDLFLNVKKALNHALIELDKMKKKEGTNISKDLYRRLKFFHSQVQEIEKLGYQRIPEEQERYKEKIARMFENDEIDEQRLQMEIVMMADKLDISEECVRLFSHLKLFNDFMKAQEPTGRKLNFLIQEMHREINTIGSKALSTNISHRVVNLKEELERIREQVQNIE